MPYKSELKDFLSLVANTFDAYTAALFLASGEVFRLAESVSLGDSLIDDYSFTHPGGGLVGWVVKNNRPINLSHFEKKGAQLFPYYGKEEPIRSFMAAPIAGKRGVLVADSKNRLSYSDKDLKLLVDFGRVIAHTLAAADARLLAREQKALLDLFERTEYRFGKEEPGHFFTQVLKEAREFTRTDIGFVALKGEGGAHYFLHTTVGPVPPYLMDADLELSGNLVGQIMRGGSSIVHENTSRLSVFPALFMAGEELSPIRSFIAMPMMSAGDVEGALGFGGFRPNRWSSFHERAIFALADRCALALEFFLKKRELAKAKWTDPVTSLFNHLSFNKLLGGRLKAAAREQSPLALIVVELCGLGSVYADLSPSEVDRILGALAGVLSNEAPRGAVLGRLAHNRFAILAPGQAADEAAGTARRVEEAAARVLKGEPAVAGKIELKHGVAAFPSGGSTPESLFRAVHQSLCKTGFNL